MLRVIYSLSFVDFFLNDMFRLCFEKLMVNACLHALKSYFFSLPCS